MFMNKRHPCTRNELTIQTDKETDREMEIDRHG